MISGPGWCGWVPAAERHAHRAGAPASGRVDDLPRAASVTEPSLPVGDRTRATVDPGWLAQDGAPQVTWTFVLDEGVPGVTRLLVLVRGGPGYRFHGLPLQLTRLVVRIVYFIMQRKQPLGIKCYAESMSWFDGTPHNDDQGYLTIRLLGISSTFQVDLARLTLDANNFAVSLTNRSRDLQRVFSGASRGVAQRCRQEVDA